MTTTNRRIISVVLSLLLVMSAPALAISKMAGGQAGATMTNCGSMMMAQTESPSPPSDAGSDCVIVPGMPCPNTSGPGSCSVSVGLLQANPTGLISTGSQSVFSARPAIYQDPFLASITPPPQRHS